ncbi:MAG TPA: M28 family peptidase [Gemmataceae bacterium]|nr:M28 family peptidase [Gemmataceae bacterium]
MRVRFVLTSLVLLLGLVVVRAENATIENLRKDLTYLTCDECEGRGAQTQGIHKAAAYIAAEYQALGLKPGGVNGTYFQPFQMRAGKAILQQASLKLQGPLGQQIELKLNDHFQAVGLSETGKASAPLVFVGYGISSKDPAYDEYKGVDVAGKIVVVLRKTPMPGNSASPFGAARGDRRNTDQTGSLVGKIMAADQAKAAGVIFVNDRDTAEKEDKLMPFDYTSEADPVAKIPAVHIHRSLLDSMLQETYGFNLRDIENDIDRTMQPHSLALNGWNASINLSVERKMVEVKNVIGVLEGKGPLADETVVIGAHYDHLGRGERGSLERDPMKKTLLHRGADDNGSGTVSVIELARRFAAMKDREGRRLVFMNFAGEEQGLIGSRYYTNHPVFPLEKTAAMLNLDMVGRVRPDKDTKKDSVEVSGLGSAAPFDALVEELNKKYEFKLSKVASGYGPSDHNSFTEKKIPVINYFTGLHTEYHRPSDTVDTINFPGMKKVVDIAQDTIGRFAIMARPQFVQTARAPRPGGRGNIPRLGIMPGNYNEADEKGVLVGSVIKDGPAEKAGMKDGDYIVEIAGKPVKNMTAYMAILGEQKRGEPLELTIDRAGKRQKITVKPE